MNKVFSNLKVIADLSEVFWELSCKMRLVTGSEDDLIYIDLLTINDDDEVLGVRIFVDGETLYVYPVSYQENNYYLHLPTQTLYTFVENYPNSDYYIKAGRVGEGIFENLNLEGSVFDTKKKDRINLYSTHFCNF